MKKIIPLFLVLTLMITMLIGCSTGSGEPSATPTPVQASVEPTSSGGDVSAPSYPIVTDSSVTLDIWWDITASSAGYADKLSNGENIAFRELEKRTGIKIEFLTVTQTVEAEKFQIAIQTGDYPSLIKSTPFTVYSGGGDKAIDDGVYLRLNELVEKWAPNYMKWVNQSDINRKNAYTDAGNMWHMSMVADRSQPMFVGYTMRQDWLDDLGLEKPQTFDEWYDTLLAFKENKTADHAAPLELYKTGMTVSNYFSGAYGVATNPYVIQVDGKIECSVINDGFREYLEMMHKWFDAGLIDPDFITNGDNPYFPNNARIGLNKSGAVNMLMTYSGEYFATNGVAEEGAYFSLIPAPLKKIGDTRLVGYSSTVKSTLGGGGVGMVVTNNCEYPEYAVRWIDYVFGDEGVLLTNYGVEGETFDYDENGKPVLRDIIVKNPDGLTSTDAQNVYLIHNVLGVFVRDREEDALSVEGKKYIETWVSEGIYNMTGNLSYTAEEGPERAAILNDLSILCEEYTIKAITGATELTDDTWNDYVAQMKSMKTDRYVEITQTAYDRYQNR